MQFEYEKCGHTQYTSAESVWDQIEDDDMKRCLKKFIIDVIINYNDN